MGALFRHPFATEAYELGYAVGFREDCSFQHDRYPNVDLPTVILDNDFRNPDLDRYLEKVDRYEPDVAILGDARTQREAEQYQQAANELTEIYGDVTPVIVPKCRDALDTIGQDTVVGYANGYSTVKPGDFSDIHEWRDRKVWILGGSPHNQQHVIDQLTQPTLADDPPADIIGLDGNGCFKAALFGQHWAPTGYEDADHLSIRETVERSLLETKGFWQDVGVWPDTEPVDRYGPAVLEPDDDVYMDAGGDPIKTKEDLESSYVDTYDGDTVAFQSEAAKRFLEYRGGLL